MADFAPGPIDLGAFPLPPRVFTGHQFQALLEPLANVLGGSDAVLGGASTDIATVTGDGLDAAFVATVDRAAAVDAQHPSTDADQTAHALVDAGGGSEAYRQSVLRYLPQPDAPVPEDYTPAPPDPQQFPLGTAPPPEVPTPTPSEPTPPPPTPGRPPAGVNPTFEQVDYAYVTLLTLPPPHGPRHATQAEYQTFWATDPTYWEDISASDEAQRARAAWDAYNAQPPETPTP